MVFQVIWSYIGFSNVNYALSEVKNPQKTVRIAGTLAIGIITILYILSNIAYFGKLCCVTYGRAALIMEC